MKKSITASKISKHVNYKNMNFKINPAKKIILYKLLRNILITLSVVWVGVLISDSILVGFISSQISFLKLTLIATALLSLICLLTEDFELKKESAKNNNFFVVFLFVLIAFVLTLANLDFYILPIIIIIISTLFIMLYLYKELFKDKA